LSSREIVDGARPRRRAIAHCLSPRARASAISSRSAKGQAAAREVTATARPHATAGGDPARALLAVRAGRHGGIGDELAALQRRPERLHHLGHLRVDEPRHLLPPNVARRAGQRSAHRDPGAARARVDRRSGSPSGLASAPTDAQLISRPGRLLCERADSRVLRSPREPKGRQPGHPALPL
jgi:hypothetical protein